MPSVRFVILQPTPFCNISCKYCYLPHRSVRARMTLETINKIFSGLFSSGWVGEELDVVWHAGEPLVLPIDYYTQAFRAITCLTPASTKVQHAFQTNGMLINDDWCRFFKTHDITVGVSIDGPEEIHNANRVTRSGKATYSEAIAGIRCLRRNDVDFSVITVLSRASLGKARELHDFYQTEGITNVCFNIEEIEGSNTSSSLLGEDRAREYENFMRQFWNLNIRSNGLYYVREFKDMLAKIVRPTEYVEIDNTLIQPFDHLNVDYEGNYCTFSPEFLGHKNDHYSNFIIGNFWNNSLAESLESEAFNRLNRDVAAGVELCRTSCEYFSVCGGGSPVNKLYENGTIVSSETMYCRLNIKVIANLAMEIIENSAAEKSRGKRSAAKSGFAVAKQADSSLAHQRPARRHLTRPFCENEFSSAPNDGTSLLKGHGGAEDIRVVVFPDIPVDSFNRIDVGTGTTRPSVDLQEWSYEEEAIVPHQNWRPLSPSERKVVVAPNPPKHTGMGIGITRIPQELLEPFQVLRSAADKTKREEELEPLLRSAGTAEGTRAIIRHVRQHFERPAAHSDYDELSSGIAVKSPGLPTVTVESQTGKLIGLHVDDWYSLPLVRRHLSPNRICVNLGCEDRFFLFLNVPVAQMYRELKRSGRKLRPDFGGTQIARTFMALYPSYPVLRLRISPGEAYIAPTENVVHDASSIEMSTMDVSLQIRGRFELSPA
jgi:uncharacterized protein